MGELREMTPKDHARFEPSERAIDAAPRAGLSGEYHPTPERTYNWPTVCPRCHEAIAANTAHDRKRCDLVLSVALGNLLAAEDDLMDAAECES